MLENARRLRLVQQRDRESDMNQHMIPDLRLGDERELNFLDHAAEIGPPGAAQRIVAGDADDPARDS